MDSNNAIRLKLWGLYKKDSTDPVPLKSLNISIRIIHNVATILYSQTYYNDSDLLLETEFFFPISPDACFDSFEATFNHTTIKGVIKEKQKAKEEYKEAVEQGRTVAYSEINEETGDIMKVQIGNIPQKTDISVTYSYIQKLETALNKFWCFRLFSTLTPRYSGRDLRSYLDHDLKLLSNYPTILQNHHDAYPWNIQAEIQSPSSITSLFSPSHDILTNYGNEKHTCTITLNPQSKHFPNKDFVLLYSNGREDKLDYLLTPFEDGYCAMVSLLADFDDKITQNEVYDNFVKAKETENNHTMSKVRGEYIFLIDRSGSMKGERITMAKKSLILFLKSLPKDSLFNVVSFGSSYSLLHNSSQIYCQNSLDSSVGIVEMFEADMGGTQLFGALKFLFSSIPPKKGYPRFLFILTDGAVTNTPQVLNLIKMNNQKARVFTIGVGNGCSPELIIKGAVYGKGKHEFVTDNTQISEKVINLLDTSLSPCYSELSLHADNFDAVVKSVSPNPASVPFLINGQNVTFFLFLRNEAFQNSKMSLKLHMYDSRIQKQRTIEITLDVSEVIQNELIPKLGIYDMIKRLEDQKEGFGTDIVWMMKENIKQAMLEYSLKYGILCKETAFFCEISNSHEYPKDLLQSKIIVPTTLSIDYSAQIGDCSIGYNNVVSGFGGGQERFRTITSRQFRSEQEIFMPASCSLQKASSNQSSSWFSGFTQGISNAVKGLSNLFTVVGTSATPPKEEYSSTLMTQNQKSISKKSSPLTLSQSADKPNPPYLDVIIKQKFEGYWDPEDKQLKEIILENNKLGSLPKEIKLADKSLQNMVWMTILVLLWLEVACKGDKKAWALIHQKGYEWLNTQGVDYEAFKHLGTSFIKIK